MEKEIYGYIYQIKNRLNSKIYIGQAKDTTLRWYQHNWEAKRYKNNNRFHNALLKYGENAFELSILDVASNKTELNEKEVFWIDKLSTQDPQVGYNTAKGGEGAQMLGKDNGKAKAVVCLETNVIYETVKKANVWLQSLGIKGANVSACIKKKQKTSGGYHWMYLDDPDLEEAIQKMYGKDRNTNTHASPMTIEKMNKIKEANHKRAGKTHAGISTICLETKDVFDNAKTAYHWKKDNDPHYSENTGFACGEYHLIPLSEYSKDKYSFIEFPVIKCIELNKYFYRLRDIEKELHIRSADICSVLSGRQHSCKGYRFQREVLKYNTPDY